MTWVLISPALNSPTAVYADEATIARSIGWSSVTEAKIGPLALWTLKSSWAVLVAHPKHPTPPSVQNVSRSLKKCQESVFGSRCSEMNFSWANQSHETPHFISTYDICAAASAKTKQPFCFKSRPQSTRPERATWRAFSLTRLRIGTRETWMVHCGGEPMRNFSPFERTQNSQETQLARRRHVRVLWFYLEENGCFIFDEAAAQNPWISSIFVTDVGWIWIRLRCTRIFGVLNRPRNQQVPMLAISNKKNRPKIINNLMIMKIQFSRFVLETFLRHLGGVGWSPTCEKHVFSCFDFSKSS